MAVRPWRLLSLCAGVGGLDLGVRLAEPEARSVCYVEREAAAASILVARMEDGWLHPAPIWSDLATFDPGAWRGAVDCVVSGDPCQPNSVAGRGLGDADERWLADRVVDVFDRSGARCLFRENVPGNADGQLAYFVPALERLGCRIAVGLFSAKELGFAHGRERLFIMADRLRDRQQWSSKCDERSEQPEQPPPCRRHTERCDPALGYAVRRGDGGFAPYSGWRPFGRDAADRAGDRLIGMAHTAGSRQRAGAKAEPRSEGGRAFALDAGAPSVGIPLLCPGPSDARWPDIIARAPHLEPAVRRVAHGVADRVDRLRACGNGVVPLVAGYAWRTLEARLAADTGAAAVKAAA